MVSTVTDESTSMQEGFESQSENRFRGRKRTQRNYLGIIITNLECSLTKKTQIQVSD